MKLGENLDRQIGKHIHKDVWNTSLKGVDNNVNSIIWSFITLELFDKVSPFVWQFTIPKIK